MKQRILVVAEDAPLRATLARWLMAAGYAVELAESPKRAREVVENEIIALAIVAPQRLGPPGVDLARALRGAIGRLIVVTETSADAEGGIAESLQTDGSISKPLSEAEVLERVRAILPEEPAEEASPDVLHFEGHTLDVGARQCSTLDGEDIPLTRAEFAMLLALARQNGRVVSRDELRQAVVRRDAGPDDRSVDMLVSRLRRKIEPDPKQPRIIVTVPGEGYRLAAAARSQDRGVPAVAPPAAAPVAGGQVLIERSAPDAPQPLRRSRVLWMGSAALVGAATLAVAVWFSGPATRDAPPPVAQRFDASVVPLITDEARNDLAAYPSQPDFKAVAISVDAYGTAMAARDASTASAEALERCKARSRPNAYCRLYAVGTDVVWSAKSLALPLPFDIHAEPLQDAFNVAELPLNIPGQADVITKAYVNNRDHRVLALRVTPQVIGRYFTMTNATQLSSAVRLATERCADVFQSPCLIVSVDGFWTVRVPKSRRIRGLFLLTSEAEMSDEDRQRIGPTYQQKDWRALARGKSGGWYPVAGAASESAAVEQALRLCAERDDGCHLHAISNFLVADDK